jgi:hypothetical protein
MEGQAKPQRRRKQIERGAPRLHTAERAESRTTREPPPSTAEPDAGARREARRQEEARGRELAGAGAMRLTAEERQMRQLANLIDVLRQAMAHRNRKLYGKTVRDWAGVFKLIDRDGSGSVSQAEFKAAMRRMGLGLSDHQVEEVMLLLDPDHFRKDTDAHIKAAIQADSADCLLQLALFEPGRALLERDSAAMDTLRQLSMSGVALTEQATLSANGALMAVLGREREPEPQDEAERDRHVMVSYQWDVSAQAICRRL